MRSSVGLKVLAGEQPLLAQPQPPWRFGWLLPNPTAAPTTTTARGSRRRTVRCRIDATSTQSVRQTSSTKWRTDAAATNTFYYHRHPYFYSTAASDRRLPEQQQQQRSGWMGMPRDRRDTAATRNSASRTSQRMFGSSSSSSSNNINSSSNKNNNRTSPPLGAPIPRDEHACSVSLPTWSSVVGYEEGDARITTALRTGYPRFVYHPYTVQLMRVVLERYGTKNNSNSNNNIGPEDCLILPTPQAAARCQLFLQMALLEGGNSNNNTLVIVDNAFLEEAERPSSSTSTPPILNQRIRRIAVGSNTDCQEAIVHAVIFPAQTMAGMEAKAYWQHTGEVVSSRRAERALAALGIPIQTYVTTSDCDENENEPNVAPCVYHSAFDSTSNPQCAASDADKPMLTPSSNNIQPELNASSPHEALRGRIAEWARVPDKDHVFLTPSGMAAIYTALRSSRRLQMSSTPPQPQQNGQGGTSIVYGFPYLDTLKLCSRQELCPAGVEFFGRGDARDLKNLESLLRKTSAKKSYSALFTEVPSNPLLQCPDLYRLRDLADKFNFCLVVDDTISNWLNVDILESGLADAVCTSLTKLVSGRGDAIAGSVVTNPNTERGRWMQQDLLRWSTQNKQQHSNNTNNGGCEGGLYGPDALAILRNSDDFVQRNASINQTAESLADWLFAHPDVKTVYYPKHSAASVHHYEAVKRRDGGYGGLMSIILHSHMCQRTFYDALNVAKGPSLGTNFTLVCPYTLLAHYHELDFAMNYNVPPNLLRVSVGLEPLEELQTKFATAFHQSRLYPKICHDGNTNPDM